MEKFLLNKKDVTCYKFADQDFLNEYFPDFKEIPYIYNTLKTFSISHADLWDLKTIKNIHYIADKPWDVTDIGSFEASENPFYTCYRLWWAVYLNLNDQVILDFFQ